LGLSLGHGPGGSIWVDLSQCMDKSDYYYSFKIQLESSPDARFKSRVKRVNLVNPILKKKIQNNLVLTNFFLKKSMGFLPVFHPELT
jgi:hypothetical protein